MRAASVLVMPMVLTVFVMLTVFVVLVPFGLAVPMFATEAVTEQRLVGMVMTALLRSAEKAAGLVFVQKVEHVLTGGEDIAHADDSVGIHDRG